MPAKTTPSPRLSVAASIPSRSASIPSRSATIPSHAPRTGTRHGLFTEKTADAHGVGSFVPRLISAGLLGTLAGGTMGGPAIAALGSDPVLSRRVTRGARRGMLMGGGAGVGAFLGSTLADLPFVAMGGGNSLARGLVGGAGTLAGVLGGGELGRRLAAGMDDEEDRHPPRATRGSAAEKQAMTAAPMASKQAGALGWAGRQFLRQVPRLRRGPVYGSLAAGAAGAYLGRRGGQAQGIQEGIQTLGDLAYNPAPPKPFEPISRKLPPPVDPPEPGLWGRYVDNLRGGDPLTLAGTAAVPLAAYAAWRLARRRRRRNDYDSDYDKEAADRSGQPDPRTADMLRVVIVHQADRLAGQVPGMAKVAADVRRRVPVIRAVAAAFPGTSRFTQVKLAVALVRAPLGRVKTALGIAGRTGLGGTGLGAGAGPGGNTLGAVVRAGNVPSRTFEQFNGTPAGGLAAMRQSVGY